jgi:hypothetical protein
MTEDKKNVEQEDSEQVDEEAEERKIDFTVKIFGAITESITSLSEQLDALTKVAAATEAGCVQMFEMFLAEKNKIAELEKKLDKLS